MMEEELQAQFLEAQLADIFEGVEGGIMTGEQQRQPENQVRERSRGNNGGVFLCVLLLF